MALLRRPGLGSKFPVYSSGMGCFVPSDEKRPTRQGRLAQVYHVPKGATFALYLNRKRVQPVTETALDALIHKVVKDPGYGGQFHKVG